MNLSPNTLFDNRYYLLEMKGRGSFGEVWRARDQRLEIDVAIKVYVALDSRGVEEFKSEYMAAFGLNHPNLLHAFYYDICEDRPYLVMPYCPGSSVDYVGKVEEKTMWRFIHDVASGLEYLHQKGIVHRDIKPDNILLDENGNFLITDFGISIKFRSTLRMNSQRESKSKVAGGSIPYMAPEMFESNPEAVNATDIWALGVTMYELMTGELPFFGQGGAMERMGGSVPEIHSDHSDELKKVVKWCLAVEPWDRPVAKQLVEVSQSILEGKRAEEPQKKTETIKQGFDTIQTGVPKSTVSFPQEVTTSLPVTDSKKKPWIWGLVAAVLVLAAVIVFGAIKRQNENREKIAKLTVVYQEKVRICGVFVNNIVEDKDGNQGNKHFIMQALTALREIEDMEQDPQFDKTGLEPQSSSLFSLFINNLYEAQTLIDNNYQTQLQFGLENNSYSRDLLERLELINNILTQSEQGNARSIKTRFENKVDEIQLDRMDEIIEDEMVEITVRNED